MFSLEQTSISGCYVLQPKRLCDSRGVFVKVFHRDIFSQNGLEVDFKEEYYSHSRRGVIRGMHFQLPPDEHVKIVYCVQGAVFDVVVDLRVGSPTFGMHEVFNLDAENGDILYIPKGLAHGFCAMSETATMVYKVSTMYAPQSDAGILWNSIDVNWPVKNPIVSDRDSNFLCLADFKSPYKYEL